jgi:hypothetical protein
MTDDTSRFESDILTRGEAAEPLEDGTLPPGVTHALVKQPDGTFKLKRVRFNLTDQDSK